MIKKQPEYIGLLSNSYSGHNYLLFTVSFSSLPALNFGCLDAGILIASPVRGLRPVEAARFATEKVPKPTRRTSSPFFKALLIDSITASSASCAAALVMSAFLATASTSSDLFRVITPRVRS